MVKEADAIEAYFGEVELAAGADGHLDAAIRQVKDSFLDTATIEVRARRIVERLALILQASLLVRHGHPTIADAFCATRLGGDWGHAYGTLPPAVDLGTIIDRATPKVA